MRRTTIDYRDMHNIEQQRLREGEEIGLVKGRAEGLVEGKTEVARTMKQKGLDPAMIAELTGLSIADIAAL